MLYTYYEIGLLMEHLSVDAVKHEDGLCEVSVVVAMLKAASWVV